MFWHLRISGYSGEHGWQSLATDVDSGNADESFAAGEMLTDVLENKSLEVQVQMDEAPNLSICLPLRNDDATPIVQDRAPRRAKN